MTFASGKESCRLPGSPYSRKVPLITTQPNCATRAARFAMALALLLPATGAPEPAKTREQDLRTLRASFRQNLLNAILPENRAYAAQLGELERQLAAARDYLAAAKVRDERLALEQDLTAFEQELPGLAARAAGRAALLPERIVFHPRDAALSGLNLDKDGALTGWETPRCAATWKLPNLPAGGYEVIVTYACQTGGGAAFEVRESFYVLHGRGPAPNPNPVARNLGTLRIRDGNGTLTLALDGASPPVRLRVLALELSPVNQ